MYEWTHGNTTILRAFRQPLDRFLVQCCLCGKCFYDCADAFNRIKAHLKITHELDLNADNFSKTKFEKDWPTVFDNSLPAAKICIFPPIVSADLLNWDIVEKSEGFQCSLCNATFGSFKNLQFHFVDESNGHNHHTLTNGNFRKTELISRVIKGKPPILCYSGESYESYIEDINRRKQMLGDSKALIKFPKFSVESGKMESPYAYEKCIAGMSQVSNGDIKTCASVSNLVAASPAMFVIIIEDHFSNVIN